MHTQNVNVKTAAQETTGRWGELPPMRGLDIRIQWGKARVMRVIDAERAGHEMSEAEFGAESEGYNDYRSGRATLPHLFADIPGLTKAWRRGWRFAASCDETESCSGCNNDRGEPCPFHDK
jgi:hypothetical protein